MILNWQPDCCTGQKLRYLIAIIPASMYAMSPTKQNLTMERIFSHLVDDINSMVRA
jgi:hypothetical protein